MEGDACGVGLVAATRRQAVAARRRRLGIDALKAVWHRGAVDADGKTGDGAGIHVDLPHRVLRRCIEHAPGTSGRMPNRLAVGRSSCRANRFAAQEHLPHHRRDPRSSISATTDLRLAAGAGDTSRSSATRRSRRAPRSSRS
jgi:glutamate synthase domain-containing protein 1